jgi:hypothetical protein
MEKRVNETKQNDRLRLFHRRTAMKLAAGAALATVFPGRLAAAAKPDKLIWANLLHVGMNMWTDREDDPGMLKWHKNYSPVLRFDDRLWEELLPAMVAAGMNMLVIDLADGIQYKSHPDVAVKNAWSRERLGTELARLRKLGLEPIPKMNFSKFHNCWLRGYRKAPFTPKYDAVCRDLIAEACTLFGKPRFFHLGMDEEDVSGQRQQDLWWRGFLMMADVLQQHGVRPWIWSDYLWAYPQDFLKRMPKTVVQSNWYYGTDFKDKKRVPAFKILADNGYDQIPTGSNWEGNGNFPRLVEYCIKLIPTEHLLGFLQTSWQPTIPFYRVQHLAAIAEAKAAREKLANSK